MKRADDFHDLPVLRCPEDLWLPNEGEPVSDWSARWREYWSARDWGRGCVVLAPNGVEIARGQVNGKDITCIVDLMSRAVGVRKNWYRDRSPESYSSDRTPRWVDVGGV